jgi:superfamily II DNA or RNA helicase
VPAKNANIGKWSQSGIFNGPSSFLDFESRVNQLAEEKDRGDAFEIFIEGYLATQAIAQSRQHWVVGAIPLELRERYKLPSDGTGIDGVYEAHDGSHVAYQVKYRQKANLTYREVAPFLGLTEQFSDRVIFTNASTLAHQALPRTRWVSRQDFAALSPEALTEICGWITEKPAPHPRATPDPRYQTQVLEDIAQTLETNSRATVVMACGTGKTLVALWAVEQAKPKSVLVLLPSLSLVQQTVREWTRHTNLGSRFRFICVCSDDTVAGKRDSDALELDTTDLGFRVDTDPNTVKRFLSASDNAVRVVFSTYQSSDVVSAGTKGLNPFEIAVFDEAHKTTGLAGGQFSRPLSDAHIRIKKRLFFTATPRHIDIRSKRDKDGEYKVQSMDDPEVYGPRAHTLSFKAAADKGVICPYKVVISVVDKNLVDDFARKNGITLVDGDEVGTRWVSNLVALQQAIEHTAATKAITFHSRVNLAQDFASDSPRGIGRYLEGFEIRHVNGKQRSSDRADLIQAFATAPKSVITNARCLTEGVDIPAVDMVAFIDPRQSRVDIAQAVGRAMRKPRGETKKAVGYVFVPLFLGSEGESIDDAIKGERFDAVADVLNALQEHDEELVDLIREARQARGEGKPFKPRVLGDKVMMIGPRVELSRVVESVETRLVETLGSYWDEWYGRLCNYKKEHGNCSVKRSYADRFGDGLGNWISKQRYRKTSLTNDQVSKLNDLGFDWDPIDSQWEKGFEALKKYRAVHGNCLVTARYRDEDGVNLGNWVSKQRTKETSLSTSQRERLNNIRFEWDPRTSEWDRGLEAASLFLEEHGRITVPRDFKNSSGFRLGQWISVQRRNKSLLSSSQLAKLDALEMVWDPHSEQWEGGFESLREYVHREGHCNIPYSYVDSTGFKLGVWARSQRAKKESLSTERRDRLLSLGFSWGPLEEAWEKGFMALQEFKLAHGHCLVSRDYVDESGFRLGQWVRVQRHQENNVNSERRARLERLGFIWDPYSYQWERAFESLKRYQKEKGDCRVPRDYIDENGIKLGVWASNQRQDKSRLDKQSINRLDAIGFVWKLR